MKKSYKKPQIDVVELDNDISLQLASPDPSGHEQTTGRYNRGVDLDRNIDPYNYEGW